MKQSFVVALDQGTSSTRALVFDSFGKVRATAQRTHRQNTPAPGHVEHDPQEILDNAFAVLEEAVSTAGIRAGQVAAIGITNQRETTFLWNRLTGKPVGPAIVWQDTRTASLVKQKTNTPETSAKIRRLTGLTPSAYFSASKIAWLLENTADVRAQTARGEILFGTCDSWLLWNLTDAVHATDVTNASRTMLLDINKLTWSSELLDLFELPASILPDIRPSIGHFGVCTKGVLAGTPITAILGDQQAAAFGQCAWNEAATKITYGTGCFMLMHTGTEVPESANGLLATVAYQRGNEKPRYALEGSIAMAGALVQWLRESLGIIDSSVEFENLALSVPDSGGVTFVPAFSGLLAPHWKESARGTILGITGHTSRAHIARAALDAVTLQTHDVFRSFCSDTGKTPALVRVDGGMTVNGALLQLQADLLGVRLERAAMKETTAAGAAFAAGLGAGLWDSLPQLETLYRSDRVFTPCMQSSRREEMLKTWAKGLGKAEGWA